MSTRKAEPGPCDDCGVQIVKRRRVDRAFLCTDCSVRRATVAAREMAAHSGPAYERWLRTAGPTGGRPTERKD